MSVIPNWFQMLCNTEKLLRVNGPHNVGDPHNAGLGKWRCKTQSIHLQVHPLLPACTKTCNEDFPATIFYHSELFRPSRGTIDQIFSSNNKQSWSKNCARYLIRTQYRGKGLVISIKFVDFLKKIINFGGKNHGIFSLAPRMQVTFGPHNAGLLKWEMQCQKKPLSKVKTKWHHR